MLATLGPGVTVSAVAQHLSVTKGSASVAVSALEKKDLIRKEADPTDGRVQHLKLTRNGRREAQRATQWPEVLVEAIDSLPDAERGGFLRGLIGVIGNLQAQGSVPTSRMCVECQFFRPNQHLGSQRPHHCNFIDAAIADTDLRVDCAEMEPAEPEVRTQLMEALFSGAALTPPPTTPDRNDSHP